MKKIIAALLAIVMLATSVYVTFPVAKEVQASETSVASETIDLEGANLDMIKIKMQALEEPYEYKEDQRATKLRLVASVDSLDYAAVGFKVWYNTDITNGANGGLNEKPTVTVKTGTVYERIVAANDGVAYEYSPKVVDTSSEYFVTATLVNIAEKNWDKNFYIKAYYITLDGQTVEGEGRFFNINQGTSDEIINIPIEMTKEQYDSMTTVTVAGTTYQFDVDAEKVYYDGKCGHVYINVGNKIALKSASLIQVGTEEDAPSTIYRNLNSTYTVDDTNNTAGDISWYDVYLQKYPEQTEFVISNEADLYGLAQMTQTYTAKDNVYKDKTFYLTKDMEMNTIDAQGNLTSHTQWKGISVYKKSGDFCNFAGTFDGQGHIISGIYRSSDNTYGYIGFFSRVAEGAKIRNFSLKNTTIKATASNAPMVGGLVGYDVGGTYENISVNAEVTAAFSKAGGFIGQSSATSKLSFKNCQFIGTVSAQTQAGGFIGVMPNNISIYFENCMVGGTITATTKTSTDGYAGGFCGNVAKPSLYMENCLNTAEVTGNLSDGLFYTTNTAITKFVANNVYTTQETAAAVSESKLVTAGAIKTLTDEEATGVNAFVNTMLNFENDWTVVDGDYPELRMFASVKEDEPTGINRNIPADGDITWMTLYAGTETKPYVLKDAADLIGMAKQVKSNPATFADTYFKIANNITINYDNNNAETRTSWTPIGTIDNDGSFKGNFDGQGYTISGLYYQNSATNSQFVGLFAGINNGTKNVVIENFTLSNCNLAGHHIVGGVAGCIYGGTFRNIRVADTVDVKGTYAIGGVAGRITPIGNVFIEQCTFEGDVEGSTATVAVNAKEQGVGGMIGLLLRGSNPSTTNINDCLVKGTIKNTGYNTGGICGYVGANHVLNVENTVIVSSFESNANYYSGGVVGWNVGTKTGNSTKTILNNVYKTHKNALGTGNSLASSTVTLTSDKLKGNEAYVNTMLDFENMWTVVEDGYPELRVFASKVKTAPKELNRTITSDQTTWKVMNTGTSEDPYVIKDAADLLGLADLSKSDTFADSYFVLANDITINNNNATATNRLSWTTIGGTSKDLAFKGNFNGQGHTISGLYYNSAAGSMVGLFTRIGPAAVIQNLTLTEFDIYAKERTGALVGYANGGTLSNIVVEDTVRIETSGQYVGGLIGQAAVDDDTHIPLQMWNCKFAGNVEANSTYGSGFVGWLSGDLFMEQCHFAGTVQSNSRFTGGFVGAGNTTGNITMKYCLSTGTIDASMYNDWNPNAGGFVGYLPEEITLNVSQSLSTADVIWNTTVTDIATYGPMVGYGATKETADIYASYATSEGKNNHIVYSYETVDVENVKEDAKATMPMLDWEVWQEVEGECPTLPFNATGITTTDFTAESTDTDLLASLYPSETQSLYQGELHAHAMTYGRGQDGEIFGVTIPKDGDDGKTDLSTWLSQMTDLSLDFAASYDHNQTDHIKHSLWDIKKFLYGTEAGTTIAKSDITGTGDVSAGKLHYNMIFPTKAGLETIITNSEFGYNAQATSEGGYMFSYPDFTRQSFISLMEAVDLAGGFFVHAHPTTSSFSNANDDYYFKDYIGFEVIYKDQEVGSETEALNDAYTESNYKVWNYLLKQGRRLYACAGSDTHGNLNTRALTSIYSATEATNADKGALVAQLRDGNFTAGPVGIQTCMGNITMGGSTTFTTGQNFVVNVGKFHKSVDLTHTYRLDIVTDQGVVYSQRLTVDSTTGLPANDALAIPVDTNCNYYRVEIYDMTSDIVFAIGQPIWNGELTTQ